MVLHTRSMPAHSQLLLSYEDTNNSTIRVDDALGGAVEVRDCRCGSVFCCGSILRRLVAGKLTTSDTYFFSNTIPKQRIYLHCIQQANRLWYENELSPAPATDDIKVAFLEAHNVAKHDVPRMSYVYKYYVMTRFGKSRLAYYMKKLTGLDGCWDDLNDEKDAAKKR